MADRPASAASLNGVQSAVAANLATIALYLVFRVLPDLPDEVAASVNFLVTFVIATGIGFATGFIGSRLRTAEFAATGDVTGLKKLLALPLLLALAIPVMLACASYDRAALAASAARFADAPSVSAEECAAFDAASVQAVEGPDSASYVTGKAQTLSKLSSLLLRHAVQCDRAVALDAAGGSVRRVRDAFGRSWRALLEVVR